MANLDSLGYVSILDKPVDDALELIQGIRVSRKKVRKKKKKVRKESIISALGLDEIVELVELLEGD